MVATTTNTSSTGAQVFVFNARGNRFQPKHGHHPAWPRYNRLSGRGQRPALQRRGQPRLRRVRRERRHRQHRRRPRPGDHHHLRQPPDQRLQPRRHLDPGLAAGSRNRESRRRRPPDGVGAVHPLGRPATSSAATTTCTPGAWPSPARQAWLQWTASPPAVADLDGDGRNEVVGIPNVERHIPYRTQGYAFMVLDGAYGDGHRSARRHAGFETLPMSNHPVHRPDGDWYPPSGIPAPTVVDIVGNAPARDRLGASRRQGVRGGAERPPAVVVRSTPRAVRRPSPPRWSQPT